MKTRRVDDDQPTSDNGTEFKNDKIFSCEHFDVVSDTFCCNVYNPFSSKCDKISWNVKTYCKGCKKTYTSNSEKISTSNGEDFGEIKCSCANAGIGWVSIFAPWGHMELTKYLLDKLESIVKLAL